MVIKTSSIFWGDHPEGRLFQIKRPSGIEAITPLWVEVKENVRCVVHEQSFKMNTKTL